MVPRKTAFTCQIKQQTARVDGGHRLGGHSTYEANRKCRYAEADKANSTMMNCAKGECMCLVRDYAHVYATHSTAMLPITLSNSARHSSCLLLSTPRLVSHTAGNCSTMETIHGRMNRQKSYFLPCHLQLNNLKLEFPGVKLAVLKLWSLAQKVARKYKKNA